MFQETTRSSYDEDASRVGVRTPPDAEAVAAPAVDAPPVRLELLADVSCARMLIERFGEESTAFRIVPIDLSRHFRGSALLNRAAAIIMAPVLANGRSAVDVIQHLRGLAPHVGMYVLAREMSEVARVLPGLAAAGMDEVFCLDTTGDMDVFRETMRTRLAAPAPETELRLLWKWFRESSERSLVMHCVRNGYRLDVWSIRSRVFSACRKTLQNRVSLLGLPSPGMLARCGRILHAQELERRGLKPGTAVAAILGFPSAGALHRSRRRLRKALMTRGRQALVFASLLK